MVSVTVKSLPGQGTLTCAGSACAVDDVVLLADLNGLVYTGGTNYNGADSFTYTVNDAALSSPTGTMSMTVTAVNDAPSAGATSDVTIYEDLAYTFNTATSTDVDTGDTLTITCLERNNAGSATSALPAFIGVTDNGDGTATIAGTAVLALQYWYWDRYWRRY